jgi:hypothetical protein
MDMRTPLVSLDPIAASVDLDDARESLAYWEDRARRLPRYAVRRRREALTMAERWRSRVVEGEGVKYGRGLVGALLLLVIEGRLPESARYTRRVVLRRWRQATLAMLGVIVVLTLAALVAAVELLAAFIHALG